MKVFKCKDGRNRVFSKRENAFSSYDLAVYLISDAHYEMNDEDCMAKIKSKAKSKTSILDTAWDVIFSYGTEVPHYHVSDCGFDNLIPEVEELVKKKFKNL